MVNPANDMEPEQQTVMDVGIILTESYSYPSVSAIWILACYMCITKDTNNVGCLTHTRMEEYMYVCGKWCLTSVP